jgi:hypothetical protein
LSYGWFSSFGSQAFGLTIGRGWSAALKAIPKAGNAVADAPWAEWDVSGWNRVLLRHFFFARTDADPGPIAQLVVAPEEFARAIGEVEGIGGELRDAFLAAMRKRILRSGLLIGRDAKESRGSWCEKDETDPPFVAHLLLTCLLASDISGERAAQGNFRKRLDQLFDREGSNHALEELPPLWSSLSCWLDEPTQQRRGVWIRRTLRSEGERTVTATEPRSLRCSRTATC